MTNAELGRLIGLSQTAASRLRNGHRLPSPRTAQAIAKGFGVNLGEVVEQQLQGAENFGEYLRGLVEKQTSERVAAQAS